MEKQDEMLEVLELADKWANMDGLVWLHILNVACYVLSVSFV